MPDTQDSAMAYLSDSLHSGELYGPSLNWPPISARHSVLSLSALDSPEHSLYLGLNRERPQWSWNISAAWPMTTGRFCIHGIFRSGTNFTRAVFEMNYACTADYDSFGWKHAPYPILSRGSHIVFPDIPSVFVTRNPVFALSSLQSYAGRNKRNIRSAADQGMSAFLRNPIVIFDGGNPQSAELYFSNPVELWNGLNWNYLSTVGRKPGSLHIRYEDLVAEPETTTEPVAKMLGFERISEFFQVPEKKMKNLGTNVHKVERFQTDKPFDRDKVSFKSYSATFSRDDLVWVLEHADRDLVARAGYTEAMDNVAASI